MKVLIVSILLLLILLCGLSDINPSMADDQDIQQETSSASITITMTTAGSGE